MRLAKDLVDETTCLSRGIGAVLVNANNEIIGEGWNGPPSRVPTCAYRNDEGDYVLNKKGEPKKVSKTCPRHRMKFESGEGMKHCPAIHGEVSAILDAVRCGAPTQGATLYAYCGTPCMNCMKEIIEAGIDRIVVIKLQDDSKTDYNFSLSSQLAKLAGIELDVITEEVINA